jgi:erythronate-4-phosphate dehydrogenase
MIKIIADDKIPFLKGALEPFASIRYLSGREIRNADVEDADALLIRTRTFCNESLLHGSKVQFIATATIGFDHIDTAYCDAHSIRWANAPGCNAASVQQYIASVLANLTVRHDFSPGGKTIGIIGVGHVGKKVETLARLLGMKVLLNDPPRARMEGNSGFVPLEELLEKSDLITLHVPMNKTGVDKTFHLINKDTIRLVKKDTWLINSSRGEVVDSNALKTALSEHSICGAVLDVWENEPAPDPELLELVALATPHIAGYSTDGKRNGTMQVVRSLGAHFNLALSDWVPSGIPPPSDPVIIMDCQNILFEKLVIQAILHTYDVAEDDFRFRANPTDFEKFRGGYPVRREFPAYKILLLNDIPPIGELFRALGFSVIDMKEEMVVI